MIKIHNSKNDYKTKYEMGDYIDGGTFSDVRIIKDRTTGEQRIAKKIRKNVEFTQQALREFVILSSLKGKKYVNQLLEFFSYKKYNINVYIFIFKRALYNLEKHIIHDTYDIKRIMYKLAQGVRNLHESFIIHRDLKPQNILVYYQNGKYNYEIADFGSSKSLSFVDKNMTPGVCTITYSSPEVLNGGFYDEKSDIWSLGCIFFYCLNKENFFEVKTEKDIRSAHEMMKLYQLYGNVAPIKSKWNFESIGDENLRNLFEGMFRVNPEKRFDIYDVLNHDFFCRKTKIQRPQHSRNNILNDTLPVADINKNIVPALVWFFKTTTIFKTINDVFPRCVEILLRYLLATDEQPDIPMLESILYISDVLESEIFRTNDLYNSDVDRNYVNILEKTDIVYFTKPTIIDHIRYFSEIRKHGIEQHNLFKAMCFLTLVYNVQLLNTYNMHQITELCLNYLLKHGVIISNKPFNLECNENIEEIMEDFKNMVLENFSTIDCGIYKKYVEIIIDKTKKAYLYYPQDGNDERKYNK